MQPALSARLTKRQHLETRHARSPAGGGSWTDSIKDSVGGLLTGSGRKDSIVEAVAKGVARTIGSTIGREITRGVLDSLLGGRRR
jgi:hypothetical protein